MKKVLASSALMLAAAVCAYAVTPNLSGQWSMHSSVSGTDWDQQCTFVLTDQKLTGTCKPTDTKEVQISGTSDGKTVSWTQPSEYNGDALTLTYTAKIDDKGALKGTVDVAPYGATGDFTATPVKEAAK